MIRSVAHLGIALLGLAALSCASARRDDSASDKTIAGAVAGSSAANSSKNPSSFDTPDDFRKFPVAGSAAAANSGGTNGECWGPGIHGYGKGSSRHPCCSPFHEFYLESANHDMSGARVCQPPIEGTVGCVNGTCGDGICEIGEDVACGCTADCPGAAWEGTSAANEIKPAADNGFAEVPASCTKPDLLARLQTSPDAVSCGDLASDAYLEDLVKAFECVHDAYQSQRPFELLWATAGTDSINPNGLVGRLRDGRLEVFTLQVYTGNEFGLGLKGSTALWRNCPLTIADDCEAGDLDDCLSCSFPSDTVTCECLPEGKRPNAPNGKLVELRCGRDDS